MSDASVPCKPAAPRRPALLDPASPAGNAIRTTIAAVGAMALAFALHLEVPALAVVYVLARGSAGAITMIVGSVCGSAIGLVLLQLFDQSRVAFSAALLVLTTIGTYGALGRRFSYGWVQALLSLLVLVGQSLDTPDTAVRHAFYDLADVLVAASMSFVAGASQPVALPALLQDALASRLRGLAALVTAAADQDATGVLVLDRGIRRSRALLANAWPTRLASRTRWRALATTHDLVDRAHAAVLALRAQARLAPSPRERGEALDELARALTITAGVVAAHHGPVDRDAQHAARHSRDLARWLRRLNGRASNVLRTSVRHAAHHALARLALLSPFLTPGARAVPRFAARTERIPVRPVLDRYRMRHSVKSAVAYLLILWAWVASEWGAIVPALVVSVLVATLATPIGATLRKAALRVSGVLVGGIAGLLVAVVLLPFITELPSICAIAGVFVLAFLWVQQHHERLTFAALQAAIAFVLTLVHGTAPSPTWRDPLDSLIGLAFGIIVVVGIMHAAWPIDAATSAHTALAELLALCAQRLDPLLHPDHTRGASAVRRAHAAARRAREQTVGFLHEVELYGTQFGRPAEDLARLALPVLELDALIAVLESRPRVVHVDPDDSASPDLRAHRTAVADDCTLLATCLRALPGERPRCDEADLATSRCARPRTPGTATSRVSENLAARDLIDALLRDLARALSDDPTTARRRAA
jgi:uncharacterized membrane protein YccC